MPRSFANSSGLNEFTTSKSLLSCAPAEVRERLLAEGVGGKGSTIRRTIEALEEEGLYRPPVHPGKRTSDVVLVVPKRFNVYGEFISTQKNFLLSTCLEQPYQVFVFSDRILSGEEAHFQCAFLEEVEDVEYWINSLVELEVMTKKFKKGYVVMSKIAASIKRSQSD